MPDSGGHDAATLLLLGKTSVCESLSADSFASCHGLTPAEKTVLTALANGQCPTAIARQHGVAISTVRTQIASIRVKTGATSIRDLVESIARLPPLVGVLRH